MDKSNAPLTAAWWRFLHQDSLQFYGIIVNPPASKAKVKINLIKADSVHNKENSGILPNASLLPALWVKGTGFGAWRAQAGVLAPPLSCVTVGTSAKGARVSLALQNCHKDMRDEGKAASLWGH